MKLSFVVPVYNVERYIVECCESILSQATSECEVILVDDGSTDNSCRLVDDIASDYDSVRVIHKTNGGLASARNVGFNIAEGEFVAFVDSDDRIAKGSIPPILSELDRTNPDILFLDCCKFYPDGETKSIGYFVEPEKVRGRGREPVLRYLSELPKYPESACMKIFKRSFLKDINLCFPEDGRISEDLIYVLKSLLAAKTFSALDIPYYEYRQSRDGSITSEVGFKHFLGLQRFVEDSALILCDSDSIPKDECCACCLSFVAYEYSIMLWMLSKLEGAQYREGVEFLSSFRWIMDYAAGRKARLTRIGLSVLGVRKASALLNVCMKARRR